MAVTIDPQDSRIYDGPNTILFPSDSAGRASAFLSGLDVDDNIVLASFTPDRRLRVDASVTIDNVDIGDVNIKVKLVGGGEAYVYGALNPDALSYFSYVQDQRMTFSGPYLNVSMAATTPLVQTTITRDPGTCLVSQIDEDDGVAVKTSVFTRDANNRVTFIAESAV